MPSSERIQQQTLEPSATASAKTRAGSTAVASADSEPATASGAAIETAGDEMEKVAPKPRKSRKPKATAPANALEPAATTPSPVPRKPFERKTGGEVKQRQYPAAESRPRKESHRHRPSLDDHRGCGGTIVGIALFWIVAGRKSSIQNRSTIKRAD